MSSGHENKSVIPTLSEQRESKGRNPRISPEEPRKRSASHYWRPLRRVLLTLPVLWVVVSVVFLLIHLVPGDPIVQMLGEGATASDIDALRHAYGLDAPLAQQYTHYWHGILHANLGQSQSFHPRA